VRVKDRIIVTIKRGGEDGRDEIRLALPRDCQMSLKVYNILGQKVASLVDGNQKAGYKTARWDAGPFSSEIYFYRLQAGDFMQTKKMVLIR